MSKMSKNKISKRKKTRKQKRNNNHQKKYRKTRQRRTYKAGNGEDKVTCCMCERTVNKTGTLVPSKCSIQNSQAAHRICSDCWWDEHRGFAREEASHECPGCVKGLPLTKYEKGVIDLTKDYDDDDDIMEKK